MENPEIEKLPCPDRRTGEPLSSRRAHEITSSAEVISRRFPLLDPDFSFREGDTIEDVRVLIERACEICMQEDLQRALSADMGREGFVSAEWARRMEELDSASDRIFSHKPGEVKKGNILSRISQKLGGVVSGAAEAVLDVAQDVYYAVRLGLENRCRGKFISFACLPELLKDIRSRINHVDFRSRSLPEFFLRVPHARKDSTRVFLSQVFRSALMKEYGGESAGHWEENPRHILSRFLTALAELIESNPPLGELMDRAHLLTLKFQEENPEIDFLAFLKDIKFIEFIQEAVFLMTLEYRNFFKILYWAFLKRRTIASI